jgi:transposase
MQRRSFSRDFKVEAVRLVRERGVSVAQAARDLDAHENVLRKWVQQLADDPLKTFPGSGKMKEGGGGRDRVAQARGAEAQGRARHPKKAAAYFAKDQT